MQQISTTIPTTARAYARDYDMQGSNMTLMIQVRLKDQPGAGPASEHEEPWCQISCHQL